MFIFSTENITQSILSLLLLFAVSNASKGQTYGVIGFSPPTFVEIDVSGCADCNITTAIPLNSNWSADGGLALCPDGTFYSAFHEILNTINPATSEHIPVPGMPPLMSYGLSGVVCSGESGLLYGTNDPTSGNELFEIDINNLTITVIGVLPFPVNHGMFMHNGNVYASASTGLAIIDTINPENSAILFPYPPGFYCDGITAYSCYNSAILHSNYNGEHSFYLMSLVDGTLTRLCDGSDQTSEIQLATPLGTGSTSCGNLLDLDCDNSSGADGVDFISFPFNCKSGGIPVCDIDVMIGCDTTIAEMSVSISPSNMPDGPNEFLDIIASVAPLNISGLGTSEILITNPGGGRIQDFKDAIQKVVYYNDANPLTPGPREVEVFYTLVTGEMSNVAIAYLEVEQLDSIQLDLGPDITICELETIILDASYPGATYLWSTGETTATIEVSVPGEYSVTVSKDTRCTNIDEIVIEQIPVIEVNLEGDSAICILQDGELVLTNTSTIPVTVVIEQDPSGPPIIIEDLIGSITIPVFPDEPTEYWILSVAAAEDACIFLTDPVQYIEVYPTYDEVVTEFICNGDSLWIGDHWETEEGIYAFTYTSVGGCDSLVEYSVWLLPAETILISKDTCDPDAAGVFITYLPNLNGCDTTVRTTIHLLPSDTTNIVASTCVATQQGVSIDTLTNTSGCDSFIVTTTYYAPPADTTALIQYACDSSLLGLSYLLLTGIDQCDSIVVITTLYEETDTTYYFGTSCIVSEIGVFQELFTDVGGCDSLAITTITEGEKDTTYLFLTSCDSSSLGVFETWLVSAKGCDSLIVETISYSSKDTTELSSGTCNQLEAGVFTTTFINQFGCDSIVIETISLNPSHNQTIELSSCMAGDTGTFIQQLINQFGCDSVVTTIVDLLPSDFLALEEETCILSDTGIFVSVFQNQFGCDSIVSLHVGFSEIDTTTITANTCDPNEAGVKEAWLTTSEGCDSLVITTTTYHPLTLDIDIISDYNGYPIRCNGGQDGEVQAIATGFEPLSFLWSTQATEPVLMSLSAGLFEVTVTDGNGCTAISSVNLVAPPPLMVEFLVSMPSCFEEELGFITALSSGGVIPYEYSLNGINFQTSNTFMPLDEGTYEITVRDANQCTTTDIIWINQVLPVDVNLGNNIELFIGDTAVLEAIVNIPVDSLNNVAWTGILNTDCPTCLTQQVFPLVTTSYSIEVMSVDGCTDRDTMIVNVVRDSTIYIPNIFSPNGDGLNDMLVFYTGEEIEMISSFAVYDRWGGNMFLQENRAPGDSILFWDGDSKGSPCMPGVYVYRLVAVLHNKDRITRTGDVTLLR